MEFEWEQLMYESSKTDGFRTCRAYVHGGWIVNHLTWSNEQKTESQCMVFIPDPEHKWEIY